MKKALLIIFIVALSLGACETERGNKAEGLITEEELIEYIQTHDVGLTVSDFDGVDIEDFIAFWGFKPGKLDLLWEKSLETYLEALERQEREKYFAKSKISVDSTSEEYEKFIEIYLKKIDLEVKFSGKECGFDYFGIADERERTIYISQTKGINEFDIRKSTNSHSDLLEVILAVGPEGAGYREYFCYSKNNKYMMTIIPMPTNEQPFEYIKIFCELDD